jgi:N-acetylmuramoyl-L-alanine amidase
VSTTPFPVCLLLAASLLAAPPARAAGLDTSEEAPVSVLVSVTAADAGARVVLSFSRRVEYRLDETRSRLRVIVAVPIAEASQFDRDVDSDVLKRIRFDETSRGSEIIFHLGREFDNFTTSELENPFRVLLGFQKRGSAPMTLREDPQKGAQPGTPPGSGAPQEPGAQPLGAAEPGEPPPRQPGEVRNIVIDPGHGGEEEGAVSSSGLKEKDLVLDIARQLKARLEQSGYVVALTRDEDQAVDLTERSALANHFGADLFLSIHANSSRRTAARGAETYFLAYGPTDEEARSLARSENRRGDDDEGDGSGEIGLVLWEMAQAEHLSRSSRLADLVQSEMNGLAGTKDRGVKQAPFRVLVGAAAPAVLVEVGFLTNQDEEKRLATQEYREKIAAALAAAVDRFKQQVRAEEGSSAAAETSSPQ